MGSLRILMTGFAGMVVCTALAGACIVLGGLLGRIERLKPRWLDTEFRHSVMAFGGGVLIAAVGLVLVPEGGELLRAPFTATGMFVAGGATFMALERYLARRRRARPQLLALLLDYVPESLALGGLFAADARNAPLLALLIGLQNLPEGFNAYRELNVPRHASPLRILAFMASLTLLGPMVGAFGWRFAPEHDLLLGAVMLFSAGGILYLVFQDIAPQARLERHWAPTLGAVLGFGVGMLGDMLLG